MSTPTPEEAVLKQIENRGETVEAFGKKYEIKRFTLGPASRAAEYVGPMGYLLKRLIALPKGEDGKPQMNEDQALDFAITAVSISGPSVLGLISVATNEPIEWLEDKEPMDGLKVFAKVVEKNISFFTQENFDQVVGIFNKLLRNLPSAGGEQSSS